MYTILYCSVKKIAFTEQMRCEGQNMPASIQIDFNGRVFILCYV